MILHTVVLRGPFTQDEVAALIGVVRGVEETRPDELFEVVVDAPDADPVDLLEQLSPLRPGYGRIVQAVTKLVLCPHFVAHVKDISMAERVSVLCAECGLKSWAAHVGANGGTP